MGYCSPFPSLCSIPSLLFLLFFFGQYIRITRLDPYPCTLASSYSIELLLVWTNSYIHITIALHAGAELYPRFKYFYFNLETLKVIRSWIFESLHNLNLKCVMQQLWNFPFHQIFFLLYSKSIKITSVEIRMHWYRYLIEFIISDKIVMYFEKLIVFKVTEKNETR